jgi:hypothetical protein
MQAGGAPGEDGTHEKTDAWYRVLWLTGVDYFSTLGYQPGIALLAAGALAPVATGVLALVTLFCAVPVYSQVAARSFAGQGSIAMLENLLRGWWGKLLVLVLLGFAATDFVITMTISAADAAQHAVENPLLKHALEGHQLALTALLLALLAGVFLKGFHEAVRVATFVAIPYLLLNLVVLVRGLVEIARRPELVDTWRFDLGTHGDPTNLILAAAAAMPDAYTTSAAYMPDSGGTRSIPQQITSDIMAEAAPFLASLAALIATANDALDLAGEVALLQQQTQAIAALARAAEDAVVRWAASAIDAANEAASDQVDDINENYANFEDAVNAIADAEEELAQTRIDAIDKELELTERWLTALNAAGDYVRSLELGANSSLTAVEKLSLVAADVDAAWAPFLAAQTSAAAKALLTAENLNTLIAAEQAYLAEALAQVAEKRDADLAAQRDAHDALVERLNKEHDARADLINKEHDDRIAGLNDQLDILSEQARVADEWRSVIESVGDYLTSLTLGPLAPENPMDQLEAAKANFAAAKAAFEGSPTAEGAADVQDAADALLTIAKDVLTRPSVGYQDLFADVFQTLEDLQGTATTLAGPATSKDIEIQSDLIREQIKQENLNVKALLDKETELFNGYINDADRLNKAQITAINAGAAETSRALTREAINTINAAIALAPVTATQAETQLTVLKEERDTLNTTLIFWRDWRREQLAGAADRKARDLEIVELNRLAQISAIEATRDAEVMAIGIAMRAALKANSERQLAIMGLLTDSQIEQLNVITDNMPVQQFIAQKNKDMAAYLLNIRDDIGNFLDAAMPQGSAQAGMLVPRTANYYLHKGETVTPAGAAAGHAITITINGATDPEATAKAVRREVLNVLRSGAGAVLLNRD